MLHSLNGRIVSNSVCILYIVQCVIAWKYNVLEIFLQEK